MLEEVMVDILGQLKRLADTQEKMLVLAERKYGGPTEAVKQAVEEAMASVEEAMASAEVPAPEPEPTVAEVLPYDELKARLIARGVEIKKGTKMSTIAKLWEAHKDDAVNEAAIPEPEEETEEAPNLAETESGAQVDEAPAPAPEPASAKPMTEVEARMHIMAKGYKGTPEQIVLMKKALASVGKVKFAELKEGEYEKLIEEFDRLVAASDSFLGDK